MNIDKLLLRIFLVIGILMLPFTFEKKRLKEWLIIFFLKGYISSFIATAIVRNKNISYPVRILPKFFKISIVFDYLIFPLLCVFYNRTTLNKRPLHIILQALLYSSPMTILEILLEKYTKLIKYKHKWNWIITYTSLVTTFLFVRISIAIIRWFENKKEIKQPKNDTISIETV